MFLNTAAALLIVRLHVTETKSHPGMKLVRGCKISVHT